MFLNNSADLLTLTDPTFGDTNRSGSLRNRGFEPLEEYQPTRQSELEEYEPYVGRLKLEEIKRLAEPLLGRGWVNVNSTFVGGGVAEMLRSLVPFGRQLGLDVHWCAIRGEKEFFQVTKKFHNMLQGVSSSISLEEIFEGYLDTIEENAKNTMIAADLIVIHDPQPAAMIANATIFGNVLWRCHIDTSAPDQRIWRFLLPYINQCAGAIFTMPEFVGPGLRIPVYQSAPCIDPLTEKNRQYTETEALEILDPLFNAHNIDPDRPIFAAISRYDIHKNQQTVLQAFRRLIEERQPRVPPYLIFLGNTATDDPEGEEVLAQLRELAGDDPNVRIWVNVENNDQVVGALMRIARTLVHPARREGFGLVVTEALWQGTPVIASPVGGIKRQILDGQTGCLVDPSDVNQLASRMALLLEDPQTATDLGCRGREHVRAHFLLPELVKRYLVLLGYYAGASRELPEFRLHDIAYSDIMHAMRVRHPLVPNLL